MATDNDIRYAAMLTFLRTCPQLAGILNFQTGNDNNIRIVTQGAESGKPRQYLDGSKARTFDFVIEFRKTLNAVPYVVGTGLSNLNLDTLLDVQAFVDWIDDQNEAHNYPNFGNDCQIDAVYATSPEPVLSWIDSSGALPIAKYTVTVRVEYVDFKRAVYHS